ncbi:hypothetical protein PHYPSEUDO_000332 [Phytophthora pseudosyringae]|uniref:Uncharacterized protein n=1 Tax=Phytophthora pseudosyringae TaxID=221518 RepID=A0A8T1W2R1_9STRA|nr:hypothetical protein PHYPSEUDO_000332 [Phytophthora pseudosyringae]
MTRRRSYSRELQGANHCSSSSSESSESDIESSCDSDASSDGLELGLAGTSESQQNFKRLRRIFLNRPIKVNKRKEESNQRRRRSPNSRDGPQLERRPARSSVVERRRDSNSSNTSSAIEGRDVNRLRQNPTGSSARPIQAAIDQHLKALWEQLKRHSAQRDSSTHTLKPQLFVLSVCGSNLDLLLAANQVQSVLEQAVDELEFLKQQEERALETQVRIIREVSSFVTEKHATHGSNHFSTLLWLAQSYALRLEVFQQQYLNEVAEIEDEMYASIRKRQEEGDATILAAAKKLQDQTQHALLKDLASMNNESIEEPLDSSSLSTDSSSASQSKGRRHRSVRQLRHDPLSSTRIEPIVKQTSPVSQQRAKLQAFEEKLAAFSPESLSRVKNELATPVRRRRAEKVPPKCKREVVTPIYSHSVGTNNSPDDQVAHDSDGWRASPLSPLREGSSYWKNGISLEARDGEGRNYDGPSRSTPTTGRGQAPLLSRRFLRPEEEEELRRLRTSIGLAKDWMAKNSRA